MGEDFPAGACGKTCTATADGGTGCVGDSACVALSTGSFCLRTCTTEADCWPGFVCEALGGSTAKTCIAKSPGYGAGPGCAAPTLRVGGTVSAPDPGMNPVCTHPVKLSDSPFAKLVGTNVPVGTELAFEIPAGTAAFTVVMQSTAGTLDGGLAYQGTPIGNDAVPTLIKDPTPRVVYDDLHIDGSKTSAEQEAFYGGGGETTGTFTFPDTSAGLKANPSGLKAGTWHLTVNDYAYECLTALSSVCTGGSSGGHYNVIVITQPVSTVATRPLDLGIYLADAQLSPAAAAVKDAALVRTVNQMAAFYAQAGICLRNVDVFDLPTWAVDRYGTTIDPNEAGPCSDLNQLFTLSQPGNRLNLFFVQDFQNAGTTPGNAIVGLDGTIPGPSSVNGTVKSGAVVNAGSIHAGACGAAFSPSCGADELAYIAAHEGGHWLGLYHTTEATGDSFDTLDDTPSCKCELCTTSASDRANCYGSNPKVTANTVKLMGAELCAQATTACGGSDDLMFWLFDPGFAKGKLSPEQAQTMKLNPAVQ